jgi:ATP-binding protein involved in chromosome partitioning
LLVDEKDPIIWRGPMASGAIKQFMTDVDWGELDYLIFDLPPGTGDIQLTLVQTIPLTGAVIVTTPQEVSLIDARKALKMFERVNVPVLGVVENMSYFIAPDTGNKYDIFGSGGGEKICKELNTTLLGGIPIDPRIRQGGDNGVPMVFGIPDSNETKILMDISRKLTEQVNIRNSNAADKIEILLGDED